ncbi:MAG: hypothetical protein JW947_07720 [Sedimentisphaerales bacterium]|nr:hypothetical protein [Sedimentisphaerales bacterium]
MPYKVSYDEKDNIVLVKVSGKPIREEHISAQNEAFRLCRENNCQSMLVDLLDLNTENSSTMDCYNFGEILAAADLFPLTRIAHVLPKDDRKSIEDVKFAVTVAANRGRIIEVFNSLEKAKEWLLGSPVRT